MNKKNSEHALPPKCRKLFTPIKCLIGAFIGLLIADILYLSFPKTPEEIIGFLIFEFLLCPITLLFVIRMIDNIISNPGYGYNFKVSELNKFLMGKLLSYLIVGPVIVLTFFPLFPISFFSAYGLIIYLGVYVHLKRLSRKEAFKKICENNTALSSQKPKLSKTSRILFSIFIAISIVLTMLSYLSYPLKSHAGIVIWISLIMVLVIVILFIILLRNESSKVEKIVNSILAVGIIWITAVIIYAIASLMGMITV